MKCLECGAQMETQVENYAYKECGLSNITLSNVKVSRCPGCGEQELHISKLGQLHRELAKALAQKEARLSPSEIRFLRKYLGWSGADFAQQFNVTPQTISRWENGHQTMGAVAEKLLRMCALHLQPIDDYRKGQLQDLSVLEPKEVRFHLEVVDDQWQAQARQI